MYNLTIDGSAFTGYQGQTILQVCRDNGIDIPTLCYDDLTEIYGACGLCVVEVEGNNKLVKACATEISDNMVIHTNTPRVVESRKTNLELLLSNHIGDCRAPCHLNCPAGTDCQGYVGLIANGEFESALKMIKEKIPLPAAIGRVCPHPCESKCRRALLEEPISIKNLKRFAADLDLAAENSYLPDCAPDTGKSVAVIGAGPYGLSIAYFLRQLGHAVTIFESMPKAGGMLRYGIPEYRLPKALLDREIALIEKLGVKIITDTKVGQDIAFDKIRSDYDAVCLGIGAWISTGTGAKGEKLPGVLGGIDFLRSVVRGESPAIGDRVAIVGGGNTAMDACRTAVRLGANEVSIIYRRTKDEMPADAEEIEEAEEEGVIFRTLTNPIEYISGNDGKVNKVLLQVMELGEADASGRRSPVPVDGKTLTLDVDTVILATGQSVNPDGFTGLDLTRKNGIVYDKTTYLTSLPGVFAGGDCGNDKISIAIEAIADADKSAKLVDAYLRGEQLTYQKPYVHQRDDITEKTFEDRERQCRAVEKVTPASERKNGFSEVRPDAFSAEQAIKESSRCLECGCGDVFECKLLQYARDYHVEPQRFAGEKHHVEFKDDNKFIIRDPDKCIMCGLCVRVCDEVVGSTALGFVDRGFDASVMPAFAHPLEESTCVSCGMCVALCPTGALQERLQITKSVPLKTTTTRTTCANCSVGCGLCVESHSGLTVKVTPDRESGAGLLCKHGRFESAAVIPSIPTESARNLIAHATAIAVSPSLTNEEVSALKLYAGKNGKKLFTYAPSSGVLANVYGIDCSPNSFADLLTAKQIIALNWDDTKSPVAGLFIRKAERNGAKVVHLSSLDTLNISDDAIIIYQSDSISVSEENALATFAKSNSLMLIRVLPYANSQGLIDLGISSGPDILEASDNVVLIGAPDSSTPDGIDFIVTQPSDGTFTNTEGRTLPVKATCKRNAPKLNELF